MKILNYDLNGINFLEFKPQFRTIRCYYNADRFNIKLPFPYLRFAAINSKRDKAESYLMVNAGEAPINDKNDLFYSLPLPHVYKQHGGWACLGDTKRHLKNPKDLNELIDYFWFSKFDISSSEGYFIEKNTLKKWSEMDLNAHKIIGFFRSFRDLDFRIDKIEDFKAEYGC